MKKNIGVWVLLFCSNLIVAQSELDIVKFVQPDINGTARYMSMAGAFGALGGDVSAIKDNPAGLGIYQHSETVGTLNFLFQNNDNSWYGVNSSDNLYKLKANNFSIVIASPTKQSKKGIKSGLQNSNFSFSFQQVKNFNRQTTIQSGESPSSITDYMAYFTDGIPEADLQSSENYHPFNNQNIPWLSVLAYEGYLINPASNNSWVSILNADEKVIPSYYLHESGHINKYSFSWAGNFSHMFYLGFTGNIQTIDYNAVTEYEETFGEGGGMNLNNTIDASGSGFNLEMGIIFRPVDNFRIGLSFQSPTVFSISEDYTSLLNFNTESQGYISTPTGYNSYKLQTPAVFDASAAYIFGKKGLISVEYNYTDLKTTKLMDKYGSTKDFKDENAGMKSAVDAVSTIKIGGECRLTDNFSVRAGYANMSEATQKNAEKFMRINTIRTDTEYFLHNGTRYLTAGFGYHENSWYIDLAYMNKLTKEKFYPYNSIRANEMVDCPIGEPAEVKTINNNLVITLGLKF